MNTIEDRLRAATRAAADTVTEYSQPPLRLPARPMSYGRTDRPRARIAAPRLMASLAAATAIVAVVATVVVTRDLAAGHRAAADRAAGAIKASVPPFFAAAVETKTSLFFAASRVEVGRTATGRVLATVRPPAPYTAFGAISAAGGDQTFVVSAEKPQVVYPPHTVPGTGPARLYLLRLHPGRTPAATLTALPKIPVFPRSVRVVAVALSPSGTRLAVELQPAQSFSTTHLRVYDLADGSFRVWSIPSLDQPILREESHALSWVDGDRFLATLIGTTQPRSCRPGCVRLLDTTRGGSFLAASKVILAAARLRRNTIWSGALVAPDGSRIVLAGSAGKRQGTVTDFDKPLVYIVRPSGQVLFRLTARIGTGLRPVWVGAQGSPVILSQFRLHVGLTAAIYAQHRRIPLRLPDRSIEAVW